MKKKANKKKSGGRQNSINKVCWSALSVGIIFLLGAMAAWYLLMLGQAKSFAVAEIKSIATNLQGRVESYIQQQHSVLKMLSRNEQLQTAMLSGNRAKQAKQAQLIGKYFKDVKGIRLAKPTIKDVDNTGDLHIGYADLDLLQQAKAEGAIPIAEISKWGSKQQRIALAQRVIGQVESETVGMILLGLDVSVLKSLLAKVPVRAGYVELQQQVTLTKGRVEDKVLGLVGNGDIETKKGEPNGVIKIAGSRWQVAYWRADASEMINPANKTLFIAIGVVTLLLFSVLFFFLGHYLTKTLRADFVTVINLVKDLIGQTMRREYAVKLSNTKGVVDVLMHSADELRAQMPAPSQANVADETSDLAVDPMFDQDSVAVADMPAAVAEASSQAVNVSIPEEIFGAYDIRGIVGETITAELAYELGRAIGSEAYDRGQQALVIARDGRSSGAELAESLARGLQDSGRDVIDVGMVPTPLLYFATHHLETPSGVMVTGSHNPANYNGFKIVIAGDTLAEGEVQGLRHRLESNRLLAGNGSYQTQDIIPDYIDHIIGDIGIARDLNVVIDCGNGVASEVAPQLLEELGCNVIPLYCETDGRFPNHHPDPSDPNNLQALIQAVREQQADIGLAFDGDGDRLGVVSSDGSIIWPDQLLMLYAEDILSRNPGADIIYDVKCSRHLAPYITQFGGRPMMWKTGHSLLKARMKETDALLAGELSGHIFIAERWFGFDDGLYAGVRLLEILAADPMQRDFNEIFAALPNAVNTPEIRVPFESKRHKALLGQVELAAKVNFSDAEIITIDGMRVEFADGWGLIRGSQTMPMLTLRFEADNDEALKRIQGQFRQLLQELEPKLALPF